MTADIETFEDRAAAVFAHVDPWHRLGTTLDHSFTAQEAMTAGHLGNWNVRKTPLTTITEAGVLEVPDRYATVRDNPFIADQVDVLGCVGAGYTPIQNEEHCEFLDNLVNESGAHFETAGSLRGGKEVFIAMKLPDNIKVGGFDAVDEYICAVNSHDGTSSFRVMVTPVRVVCANTLNAAMGNNRGVYSIRHTSSATSNISAAREALEFSFDYLDEFSAEAERMIQSELTNREFEKIITEQFGAGEDASKGTRTRRSSVIDAMMSLFATGDTQKDVRNTRWAGYNAITEYADHYAPVQKRDGGDANTVRAQRVILGGNATLKQTAFDLFRVPAAV